MRRTAIGLTIMVAMLLGPVCGAVADVFVLTGGGRVVGEVLNPDEMPREKFVIKTSAGRIVLMRRQVKKVLHPRPEQLQYEKIRPRYPDTAEGQWALAEWCREKILLDQRKVHLERIVELDPQHVKAHRALGHVEDNGRWTTREQLMARDGLVWYRGKPVTPQEVELLEKGQKDRQAEGEWFGKLKRWRKWLGTKRDPDGRREIMAIDDPYAVAALLQGLEKEPSRQVRIMYIEVLANIGTPEAVKALAKCSMADRDEEVWLTCLDYLEGKKHPDLTAFYVAKLRSKDNRLVNRAAIALRRLKDPTSVGPLIAALITVHKYKVTKGSPGQMSSTFGTGPGGSGAPGGSGLSMGGGPQIISRFIQNQAVLDALIAITGHNFNFDQKAWQHWHSQQRQRPALDARRD